MIMENDSIEVLIQRVQQDPTFAGQLVDAFLKLKEENKDLTVQVASAQQLEKEAQQALRQARGFSVYLKGQQGSLRKMELERQNSLRQAQEQTIILKITNKELRERLDEAKRIEQEAKLSLRQARGVTAYLKKKSASLEKQLEASKEEQEARMALRQARDYKYSVKSTMKDNDMTCSEHSRDLLGSQHSILTDGSFDLNDFEEYAELAIESAPISEELRLEINEQ